ncbi:MAG: ABC transporter substrate-binding protein [Chitinophagales bacterium]
MTLPKNLLTLLLTLSILFTVGCQNKKGSKTDGSETSKAQTNKVDKNEIIKIQAFTWGGYAGGQYFNEGFKHSPDSRFTKDHGLSVDFLLIDDFDASRSAWKADEVHLLGTTADALSTEMEGLKQYNPQIVFQVDWSRGGDAIVASKGINSIKDLKGKMVAVTPSTPSQTFLIWMLEEAGMTLADIKVQEVPSAVDAAIAFKSGKLAAAVVWSPDDEIITREMEGTKVLKSTRDSDAAHIIADVYIAKKSWIDANRDKVNKLYQGFMQGAAEINASEDAKKKAAGIMADGTGISEEDALGGINNVRLTTHGDNLNFFGKNPDYKGMTGEQLYTKMGTIYEKMGFAAAGWLPWQQIYYPGAITTATVVGDEHEAE